ncbi:hypothetical protein GCM10007963_30890 [Lutibacter litoralis]|nr:hypothetical protein GCM10007963_30890 [Lutibacter litoralis]
MFIVALNFPKTVNSELNIAAIAKYRKESPPAINSLPKRDISNSGKTRGTKLTIVAKANINNKLARKNCLNFSVLDIYLLNNGNIASEIEIGTKTITAKIKYAALKCAN